MNYAAEIKARKEDMNQARQAAQAATCLEENQYHQGRADRLAQEIAELQQAQFAEYVAAL